MKKILALSAMSLIFSATSVFAACPCVQHKINTCDPCEKPKVTICQPVCQNLNYQTQCCNKKNIFQRLWSGTKVVYDNSVGAIYDTMMVPFR